MYIEQDKLSFTFIKRETNRNDQRKVIVYRFYN